MATLTDTELSVMTLRYGIDQGKPRTLAEVSDLTGMTRDEVRKIEADSLIKLFRESETYPESIEQARIQIMKRLGNV